MPESVTGIPKIRLAVNKIGYPDWIEYGIGSIIEFLPLVIVVVCAIYQINKHKNDWVIKTELKSLNLCNFFAIFQTCCV